MWRRESFDKDENIKATLYKQQSCRCFVANETTEVHGKVQQCTTGFVADEKGKISRYKRRLFGYFVTGCKQK